MNFKKIIFYAALSIALFSCSKPDPTETVEFHEVGAPGQPQFMNNWANTGTGSKCSFTEDCDSFITLKGTAATTSAIPSVIFYLPEGHCPDEDWTFQGGNITVKAYAAAGTGSAVESKVTPVTLDGISFLAER